MAKKYTVHAPEKDFSGEVAGVSFSKGKAEVDAKEQAAALAYFQRKGYAVDGLDDASDEVGADQGGRETASEDTSLKGPVRAANVLGKDVPNDAAKDEDKDTAARSRRASK